MKAFRPLLLWVALLLSGCPVYQVNTVPSTARLPGPETIVESGDYSHSPSGYKFPIAVGGFERVNISRYDSAGLNVGVGYNGGTQECKVALTIYVYPAPKMSFIGAAPEVVQSLEQQWLGSAYQAAKHDIESGHPGAVLKLEDSKVQNSLPGRKAVYQIDNTESVLYVFLVDRTWFLKYRITYQDQCSGPASTALDSFFANWKA